MLEGLALRSAIFAEKKSVKLQHENPRRFSAGPSLRQLGYSKAYVLTSQVFEGSWEPEIFMGDTSQKPKARQFEFCGIASITTATYVPVCSEMFETHKNHDRH